jgi:hypothetical protein
MIHIESDRHCLKPAGDSPPGFLLTMKERIAMIMPHVPRNIDRVAERMLMAKLPMGFLCIMLHV